MRSHHLYQIIDTDAQLQPGNFLPSVRQLARDLGVAPNTVVRAYTELERDGWVVTSARRGVSVAAQPPIVTPEERQQQPPPVVANLLVKAHQLGVGAEELRAEIDRQLSTIDAGTR